MQSGRKYGISLTSDRRELAGTIPEGETVRADQVATIDLAAVDELVYLDNPGRFQGAISRSSLGTSIGVGADLIALHDVLVGDLLAGVGIDLEDT